MSVGSKIRKLRIQNKLSQPELASKLNISQTALSEIESGKTKKVDFLLMDKVCNVFAEGFGALHWSQMYYPNMSPMNAYIKYYGKNDILNINKTKQLVRQHSKIK